MRFIQHLSNYSLNNTQHKQPTSRLVRNFSRTVFVHTMKLIERWEHRASYFMARIAFSIVPSCEKCVICFSSSPSHIVNPLNLVLLNNEHSCGYSHHLNAIIQFWGGFVRGFDNEKTPQYFSERKASKAYSFQPPNKKQMN